MSRSALIYVCPLVLVTLLLAQCDICQADEAAKARRVLESAGLTLTGKGWVTASESELRRKLALLPKVEKTFYSAQQDFRTLLTQFQNVRGQLQRQRTRLSELSDLIGQDSTGPLEKQELQSESASSSQEIKELEKIIASRLNVLDESSEMTVATVELVNAQTALGLHLLEIRQLQAALPGEYQQLSQNDRVRAALKTLAGESVLGPLENYASQSRKLDRLGLLAFTDGITYYRRSGQIRITAILNEQWPLTFSYAGATGPTLLPASVLQASGIDLSQAPPGQPVQLADRVVITRRIVLPSLRLGKFVWRNVPVDVLPPEAEDIGARISQQAFEPQQAKLKESELVLKVE